MKSYILISSTLPKNQLQAKVDELACSFNKKINSDPIEFRKKLQGKIKELNKQFPRCRPVKVSGHHISFSNDRNLDYEIYLTVSELDSWRINISFNNIIGEIEL